MNDYCEECNSTEKLVNHHVSYEPEITKTLCRSCHGNEHKKSNAPKAPEGLYKKYDPSLPKIQISADTWTDLNSMKRPGESFDDVVRRLLHYWTVTGIPKSARAEG